MSRWNSRASASMDLDAYDEDRNPEAVPLPIDDAPTKPIPAETPSQLFGRCMVCHRATAVALCLECWARKEGR